jgi:hypothetical protein
MPRATPETALRIDEHRQKTLQAGEPGGSGEKYRETTIGSLVHNLQYYCFSPRTVGSPSVSRVSVQLALQQPSQRKGHGANLRKKPIRPVGAKPTLAPPKNFRRHLSPAGGMLSSHNDSFVASGSSPTPDFLVENHGSMFLLQPLTPAAESWIEEFLPEDRMSFGSAVVVEHRYIADIVEGIRNEWLAVS